MKVLEGKTCEHCGYGEMEEPLSGLESYLVCNECKTIEIKYVPMEHQAAFHQDTTKYKMYAGGYGSGKTTTACQETIEHILSTPRGATLIGAATLPQLEQTAMKEFFEQFPPEFIKHYNKQKAWLDTTNGHRVIFRPLDDEGKARSLNLSCFWIEEASEVPYEYFDQLKTRLRNKNTDHHKGILSTNPDMGWIKTEFLLKAGKIYNSEVDYQQVPDEINDEYAVHIAPTHLNYHLPKGYYESQAKGKPDWWIRRFLHGSFENKEGLVYPMYNDYIVDDFEIPQHWERYMAVDFGKSDPTAVAWAAIDPQHGDIYFYKEHYEAEKPIYYHASVINKHNETIPHGLLHPAIGDAKGKTTNASDMRSVFDYYAEYGIYFKPSTKKLEDSIQKKFNLFSLGKVKIFKSLKWALWEFQQYKYPDRKLDKSDKATEKPEDKNNHMMDAIRYLLAELPDDPEQLRNPMYSRSQMAYDSNRNLKSLPHALQTTEQFGEDWYSNY